VETTTAPISYYTASLLIFLRGMCSWIGSTVMFSLENRIFPQRKTFFPRPGGEKYRNLFFADQ
jgi:hypothetical protein